MRKVILTMTILFLAGCNITAFSKKKEEDLMPITQAAPQKDETLPQIELMPVAQVVEKIKEKEKLFSLSANDMELRKVLFMFAEELPEYNVVIAPDVSGKVTVDVKKLSLDNVLTILLEPLDLEYTIEDNILRISKPRMVTRTFEFVYSTTIRNASTSLVAMTGGGGTGGEGGEGASTSFGSVETKETINVWEEMEKGIKSLLSDEGELNIVKRVGYITVTDYRSNMKEIENFIDFFGRETKKQILIKAKILEVTLTEGYAFGIDWNAIMKGVNLFGRDDSNPGSIVQQFAPKASDLAGVGFKGFAGPITSTINHTNLEAVITALETQGKVTVLSSPQVSTLNGQKAIIRSVREDVVFESSQSSSGTGSDPIATTTAKPFTYGVFLDVTPHVDSEGMITMDIHPSVSSFFELASSGGAQQPIIDTRETETVATIKEGEAVIIAGLMQDNLKTNISKFPILGDIPYIKKLFRREIKESQKTELVILIAPTIVGPKAKDFGNARENYEMLRDPFKKL